MIKQTIISEMEARGQSISSLAKIVGCSYPTMYNFIMHDKGLSLDFLEKLLEHYNLKLVKIY